MNKPVRIAPNSRQSDERTLRWLKLRAEQSATSIATAEMIPPGVVINATKYVAQADAAESGEDVSAAYPWHRAGA